MSLSSYCRNCGKQNGTIAEMGANHCNECEEARTNAIKTFVEQATANKTEINESDKLYAGRTALGQRAHHPRQTFINPREFNRMDSKR